MSGVPQGSVLGPLLLLAYVNNIWRNIKSTIRLFADNCIIYRKIINNKNMGNLQIDLNRLGEWAVENAMAINPAKRKQCQESFYFPSPQQLFTRTFIPLYCYMFRSLKTIIRQKAIQW
jgi:hypothetical protein